MLSYLSRAVTVTTTPSPATAVAASVRTESTMAAINVSDPVSLVE